MKFLSNAVSTILFTIILHFFFPWWSIMLAAFLAGTLFPLKKAATFFAPFSAITVFWSAYAALIANQTDSILIAKIAVLFPLGGNTLLLILVTGIIGGVAAGAAGVSGQQLRKLFTKEEHKINIINGSSGKRKVLRH